MSLKILKIEARDIHVTFEMSATELRQLRDAIGISELKYNSEEEPQLALAAKFLENEFYPFIHELVEDLARDGIRPDSQRG